mmetsp:Transcript_57367/g.167950  ORF Transcript_57367/g.167950 Transcript_57367/m.167950 type:complete len:409 (-) Transcript_57367:110-1336(-)
MAPGGLHAELWLGGRAKGKAEVQGGRRLLQQPRGLHLASDGSLLVADFGSHCVLRFARGDAKGAVVAGEPGRALQPADPLKDIDRPLGPAEGEGYRLMRPLDVCQDSQGDVLVLDAAACRLQRFSMGGGPASTLAPAPRGPPQKSAHGPEALKGPRAVLLEASGDILLCDTWSHRILRYLKDGEAQPPEELAGTPNSYGRQADQLAFPSCIALDAQGCLLVSDTNNHRIQRLAPGERSARTIAGSQACAAGSGPGELNMPTGLCVDPRDGSVIVADRGNKRVLRFQAESRAGDAGEVLAGPDVLEHPWGVCLDSDGSVFVSDERKGVVLRLSVPGDDFQEAPAGGPAPGRQPQPVPGPGGGEVIACDGDSAVEAAAHSPEPVAEPVAAGDACKMEHVPLISGDPMELD